MKLSEIIAEDEPLIITLMKQLLKKRKKIWAKGAFAMLEVTGFSKVSIDTIDYTGPAYNIKVSGGVGYILTPNELEAYDITPFHGDWRFAALRKQ